MLPPPSRLVLAHSSARTTSRIRLNHLRNAASLRTPKYRTQASAAVAKLEPEDGQQQPSRSVPPGQSPHYEMFAHSRRMTRLPTPLPPDIAERTAAARRAAKGQLLAFGDLSGATLSSANEQFYPRSGSVENIAIMQACLSARLVGRASKIFEDMRADCRTKAEEVARRQAHGIDDPSYVSPVEVHTYDSFLGAYLSKAWHAEKVEDTSDWIRRAWNLFGDMQTAASSTSTKAAGVSIDPAPCANSYAVMARGVVRLQQSNRYPASEPGLSELLASARRQGISLDSVLLARCFDEASDPAVVTQSKAGEPDANMVLRALSLAASQMGDSSIVTEVETARQVLSGFGTESSEGQIDSTYNPLEGVPELKPVLARSKDVKEGEGEMQKPFNLTTLQQNLSVVQEARQRVGDPYERQKWLEHSALDAARKRLAHSAEKLEELGLKTSGALQSRTLQSWMWEWYNKLEEVLKREIDRLSALEQMHVNEESGRKRVPKAPNANAVMELQVAPFLKLLPTSKLALIPILELMRLQGSGGVADGMKTTRALLTVGRAVEMEYHSEVLRKNPRHFANARQTQNTLGSRGLINMAARKEIRELQARQAADGIESQIPRWTQTIRARVGSFLVQWLQEVATVKRSVTVDGELHEEEQPAFHNAYQYLQGKKLGVIKLNPVIIQRLDKESVSETLHPRHLPMLVPPKPWLSHDSGGYYSVRTSIMRFKDSVEQGAYLRAAQNELETISAGLDVLGSTAWVINRQVYDIMSEVWNSGVGLADIPPASVDEPEPDRPENYDSDIKAKGVYLQRLKMHARDKSTNHSQRCDVNYKLEIARAFLGDQFFFPHNMDFRGRAYPIPPHLNHIGNDLCRGLLLFSKSKPLGEAGLRWLRIHLANVYGFDKASFAEREAFAIEHEADMRDSVRDPLGGNGWWLQADDPWQCLATSFELAAALDHPEGPEKFESSLPVHQDGTCNGLQHYAALGGDLAGAKQVNLSGGDRPSDVYTGVAELVIRALDEDAAAGHEHAKRLQGKITRKVVKQTVMTTVYGVTFVGAKNQIQRQLADRGDIPAEELWSCASYLAKRVMACIGDLFTGAQKIQDWLSDSAKLIAKSIPPERLEDAVQPYMPVKSHGPRANRDLKRQNRVGKEQMTSVIWTTPLGLPVVQPYRKLKKKQVATAMQTVYIHDPYASSEVSPGKQASAFPPNFIHSLDATHMILTAIECSAAELTFASVHDSYWTHACDIDTMSDIIRDTFVRLHSEDILVKLREEFLARYAGFKVPVVALNKSRRRRPTEAALFMEQQDMDKLQGEQGKLIVSGRQARDGDEEGAEGDEFEGSEDASGDGMAVNELRPAGPTASSGPGTDAGGETMVSELEEYDARFVDLAKVLPPIPDKGNFDVNEIRRSLYFFS